MRFVSCRTFTFVELPCESGNRNRLVPGSRAGGLWMLMGGAREAVYTHAREST